MDEKQIKYMAERFLGWRLPDNFSPDGGVKFERPANPALWPSGTNVFDYNQAVEMVRHMVDGMPDA